MRWLDWVRTMFHGRASKRADDALSLATEVINSSRSIRQQLEPFRSENDPFAAIARWHRISDDFNAEAGARQVRNQGNTN